MNFLTHEELDGFRATSEFQARQIVARHLRKNEDASELGRMLIKLERHAEKREHVHKIQPAKTVHVDWRRIVIRCKRLVFD